jgi:endonuclease/exonuclease/phosphatase (EEP) superfamily protein YafD
LLAFSAFLLAASAALCIALWAVYQRRPDAAAAVTVLPPWVWVLPGLALVVLGRRAGAGRRSPSARGRLRRATAALLLLWGAYLAMESEEWPALLRAAPWRARGGAVGEKGHAGRGLRRVISLNCAGGDAELAAEVAVYHPDVVFLQESPGRREVEALARRLFPGPRGVLCGPDASMLARGRLTPRALPPGERVTFVQARAELEGVEAELISLRLMPALARYDLWAPECWRAQQENRGLRRAQLAVIARRVAAASRDRPVILGGDFNAPAGDAVVRLLQPRLHDAFTEGGLGWGCTFLNDFPVIRIDQLWIERSVQTRRIVARQTRGGDHRMVIADLLLR